MSARAKVAVGMSGGVDSTMAVLLLQRMGHEVIGLTMLTWDGSVPLTDKGRSGCYGPSEKREIERVRAVAAKLGIVHHAIPLADEYKCCVLDYFRADYLAGRTPNPCVVCNEKVKFLALPAKARAMGITFDFFATGHYARVVRGPGAGRWLLNRAVDRRKDQSYFLSRLSQEQLRQLLLPLGAMTKVAVKALARESGFDELAGQAESQDFLDSGEYPALFAGQTVQPGPILDMQGRELGQHKGIVHYTVGQRKGLGLGGTGEPLYVVRIDSERNAVIVGPREALYHRALTARGFNWIAIESLTSPLRVHAKIRQQHTEAPATVMPVASGVGETARVVFDEPQMSITPGQTVVLYEEDTVVGGGTIMGADAG